MAALIISLSVICFNIEVNSLIYMAKMEHEGQLALPKNVYLPISEVMIRDQFLSFLFPQFESQTSNH